MACSDDAALAWQVERACLAAWPALHQTEIDGWVLRFSEGLTRRANSVNATRADVGDISQHLDAFAAAYRALHLPLIVRVPTLLPQTDRVLAQRGFTAEGESCALYGDLAGLDLASDPAITFTSQPNETWFAAMARLQNQSPAHRAAYRRIIARIESPAGFATLKVNDDIAAVAFGGLYEFLFCCESVVVDAALRGQGLGRRLMRALFHHARQIGATSGCLQVEASNEAGRALYRSIGLSTELSRYHYRRAVTQGCGRNPRRCVATSAVVSREQMQQNGACITIHP